MVPRPRSCTTSPPIPAHAILWRITRPRPSAARLLRALQAAALPGWGAVVAGAQTTTLYVWAPGHQAALLTHLVASLPSGATPVPAAALPCALRWQRLAAR